MNAETAFTVFNTAILPAWLLLALFPFARITQWLVHSLFIPLFLGAFYLWFMFTGPPAAEGGGFGSLEALGILFARPESLLAGWIHYLVFDLFVGAWEVRDAKRLGINHWLLLPCLLFTLMAGPAGLLLYLAMRAAIKGQWLLAEQPSPQGANP